MYNPTTSSTFLPPVYSRIFSERGIAVCTANHWNGFRYLFCNSGMRSVTYSSALSRSWDSHVSTPFDLVRFEISLPKLSAFGSSTPMISWISSFLSNRIVSFGLNRGSITTVLRKRRFSSYFRSSTCSVRSSSATSSGTRKSIHVFHISSSYGILFITLFLVVSLSVSVGADVLPLRRSVVT